ncbi:DNA-formamidopyrimidine glycosylase [Malacoplasma iowae]|uniref:DNA-formamidopyrimidine glycosylase n=1 Tax=Malacoplasma iowae TaxID=2116 RepID=UPI002A187FD5|nr:DNA-formamidopyrimidine glycosylase [Malacoplasma iowae]WPL37555.1 DNA-formamidopyrimidine glycosylase [Malacoplasma iowae]
MPELPEVQSMIDSLVEQNCTNHTIIDVWTQMPKLFKNATFDKFKNHLLNEKISTISRVGKYLIFHLTNDKVFVVHLWTEGKLFYEPNDYPINQRHTLVRIVFDNKHELRYEDTRRFGTFTMYFENDYLESKELKKLALDPLNKNFNSEYLKKNIGKSNRAIKTLLLDQTNVSGIGNIYADEILFASKINPNLPGNKVTKKQFDDIALHANRILNLAVENKGTTISTYFYKKEKKGEFQNFLKVHTKKGYPCPNCKTTIEKTKVNGRGTYYCPKCQKLKKIDQN